MDKNYKPPCKKCDSKCCKYIAIEIDRPITKIACDHIMWYLHHENVNIFVDHDKKWHVEFRTPCERQGKNNECSIYETRPKLCEEHGTEEADCEYFDAPYTEYFSSVSELEEFLDAKKMDWRFRRR